MSYRTRFLIAVPVALLGGVSSVLAALPAEVEIAIRGAKLENATVAVSIADAASGELLTEINGNQPMIPASNMKLFTTGAALHVLGHDFEFTTRLTRCGDDLVVVGDGDPAFADPELLDLMPVPGGLGMDFADFLSLWVDPVSRSGLTTVDEIIVDDRIFERELVHPNWPEDQLNRSYCAEVSGFNFHLNLLHFFPRPSAQGLPEYTYTPAVPNLSLSNKGTSRQGVHDQSNAWIAREHLGDRMVLYGNVKFAYRQPLAVTMHDPALVFAGLLESRLERAGISVSSARLAREDETLADLIDIAPVVRTPIATAVTRCNRDSENLYAEALLKRSGYAITHHGGSWINGSAIVRQVVYERLSQPSLVTNLLVDDGSGLSRENRITANTTTAWLGSFHRDETLGPVFIESLARAGESGTLAKRFKRVDLGDMTVHAKTGYINGVSCLSGYVTDTNGRRCAFSVLVNDLSGPGQVRLAKRLQERVVELIVDEMRSEQTVLGG